MELSRQMIRMIIHYEPCDNLRAIEFHIKCVKVYVLVSSLIMQYTFSFTSLNIEILKLKDILAALL